MFLIFATIVCVISSIITVNVIKYLWGRVRYREMIAEADRHPELTAEIAEIRNDLELQNGLVQP